MNRSAIGAATARPLTLAALLAACGPPNSLEGSLTEIFADLQAFTATEVTIDPGSALSVAYTKPRGDGRDFVFRIVVKLAKVTLDVKNKHAELAPEFDGQPKAVCSRGVADDPRRALAPVKTGMFDVDRAPEANKPLSGSFRATLGEGGDAGRGRTAFGTFWTKEVIPSVGL